MIALLVLLCLILLVIVVIQIGRISEVAGMIRGEEDIERDSNYWNSRLGLVFMVLFLLASVGSAIYYKNYMLGYGPHEAASIHGLAMDQLFNMTLFFTGIVFIITQIILFWFAYKYRGVKGQRALHISHDNKLEVIWTAIPAVVMAILVVFGLNTWNEIMQDIDPDGDHIEIEMTAYQFGWIARYPGADGVFGARDYQQITGRNPLGQVWEDPANHDDMHTNEIVLPVNRQVKFRLTARDVLHSFFLPHFRVKMDCVPGTPTFFVFTPTKTTEEYRRELSKYAEYQVREDPNDPTSPMLWETFNYELACAELCGTGHFSMRMIVRVVEEAEYKAWLENQSSYYLTSIRNTDFDPFKGMEIEIDELSEASEGGDEEEETDLSDYDELEAEAEGSGSLSEVNTNID
ncbi:MAG: cytochrome c oxidase subunit II [Saprospirales bacterium]|nr:MAG: cytochrome c oxidase subunit II [Saprospirales bacterium]